ncbi:MAG: hypothetical protein DIU79_13360 [Actinobacteria bacterium]|nr:MAG: hypothetical protein DIU79_13360 [Actinomycetota bacterium]
MVIGGLASAALLAVCGLSAYFLVADERQGRQAQIAETAPTAIPRDISSREVDPEPLTEKEVFPNSEIVISVNEPPYQVLRTQENKDCRKAVAGEIAKLLTELGCSQVVRGTLRAPNSAYLVTAGVFNLRDIAAAETAHEKIKPLVNNKKGRFQGMVAGEGTDAIALSSAQVGWHIRGHYLVYCVIARADGEPVTDVDPYARQILYDMIELHLRGDVLEKRATVPVDEASPSPASSS